MTRPSAPQPETDRPTVDNPYRPTSEPGRYGAPYRQDPEQTGYLPYPENGRAAQEYGAGAGRPVEGSGLRTLWILGFVLGALGLLIPLVGVAGIVCGALAWSKGSARGRMATGVAVVATIVGVILGAAAYL